MNKKLITVKGNVQGVCFRSECKRIAEKNNIKGFAKNLDNGDVEIFLIGEDEKIKEFIGDLNSGKFSKNIENMVFTNKNEHTELNDFLIL